MAIATPNKVTNSCMEEAKKQAEQMRKLYFPSNADLLKHILELKEQVKVLSEKIDKQNA